MDQAQAAIAGYEVEIVPVALHHLGFVELRAMLHDLGCQGTCAALPSLTD